MWVQMLIEEIKEDCIVPLYVSSGFQNLVPRTIFRFSTFGSCTIWETSVSMVCVSKPMLEIGSEGSVPSLIKTKID